MDNTLHKNNLNVERFDSEVVIASPGRINLIGEHLDYNGGTVLPAAIDLKVKLHFKKTAGNTCRIHSKNLNESLDFKLERIEISETEWHNYFLGVIHFIEQLRPNTIFGFDCIVESNLPIGSGVSSSAALECGIATGLNELFDIGLNEMDIITISRDAEHHFVGTKCGIMDQFTVVKGRKDKLIQLNCKDLSFDYIPAQLSPYTVVLLNSNVSHNLATSEYNLRRQECEAGLNLIQRKHPLYESLAEIPLNIVEQFQPFLPASTYKRIKYVVQEQARTLAASVALKEGHLNAFGAYLFESHFGLRDLYEVSCAELDFLVDLAKEQKGVIGSRMMGGGFGGCTINLVHETVQEGFIESTSREYFQRFKINLTPHRVSIGDGVKQIQN
ncbi:MAG: galactokinase [Bacteroidota bacterium]